MSYSHGSRIILRLTLVFCSAALCLVCAGMAMPSDRCVCNSSAAENKPIIMPPSNMQSHIADISERYPAADHLLNEEEIELLARVISAEARGESYDGQVAVGAVILNRMEHPGFPDSLSDVCYQPGAFNGVADGQIDIPPSESCLLAAADAASGRDPTGGAVFFYNPDTAADGWIRTRQVVAIIGGHCFCV